MKSFSFDCRNFQVGIEGVEKGRDQALETIENRQDNNKRHGSNRNPYHRNRWDNIDDVVRFLRKQIPSGDIEWEAFDGV